jgi:hypothetical protein
MSEQGVNDDNVVIFLCYDWAAELKRGLAYFDYALAAPCAFIPSASICAGEFFPHDEIILENNTKKSLVSQS